MAYYGGVVKFLDCLGKGPYLECLYIVRSQYYSGCGRALIGVVLVVYCVILPAIRQRIKLSTKLPVKLIINKAYLGINDYETTVFIGRWRISLR